MSDHFSTRLDAGFAEPLERAREALKWHGFGIISEIDIQNTLRERISVDFRPYTILDACNPTFAQETPRLEDKVGTMLSCNVVVQETGDRVEVAATDPVSSIQALENEWFSDKAALVAEKLRQAIDELWVEKDVHQQRSER